MDNVDTLEFLLGTWRVARSIEDHRSGTRGSFAGTASLARAPSAGGFALGTRAHYEEVGELSFGDYVGPARRSLEYVRLDNGALMLHFTDGRPFVDLDLSAGAWQSTHLCADDRYEIATFVRSRNIILERWRVRGPATEYDAATTLRRSRHGLRTEEV